jgi:glyceraldehyde 3-phosphate dehydrogenase
MFGRIGRTCYAPASLETGLDIVAINDITDAATLGHLLRHDSVHGQLKAHLAVEKDALILNGKRMQILQERDPESFLEGARGRPCVRVQWSIYWIVISAATHLTVGAKKVLISAPAKGADITLCYGVNPYRF